tara:strand:- start:215 stop:586 length:372 start_codon:yes stop_codon:yes gene_type:complete
LVLVVLHLMILVMMLDLMALLHILEHLLLLVVEVVEVIMVPVVEMDYQDPQDLDLVVVLVEMRQEILLEQDHPQEEILEVHGTLAVAVAELVDLAVVVLVKQVMNLLLVMLEMVGMECSYIQT